MMFNSPRLLILLWKNNIWSKHLKLTAALALSITCSCGNSGDSDSETLSINFEGETIAYNWYTPAVFDINNDGFIEALGTFNDGNGNLSAVSAETMGLQNLFASGRSHRDARITEFNGDGYPDIISNTYSSVNDTSSSAMLFFGNGDGTFTEDTAFAQLGIRGYGETILAADFDNDGDLDVFLPYYSHNSAAEHSYLLINDGQGNFTDISDSAGVGLRDRPLGLRVEGAQAVDFNLDGWIDFYVAGHLFMNNGDLTFTDKREELGLPELFDEGIKFLDWNNDGYLDLIVHNPSTGPALYAFDGQLFNRADVIPSYSYEESYGMNIYDLNNDGREDIFTSGGSLHDTIILLNNGSGFERSNTTEMDTWGGDLIAFGDIDRDGRIDIVKRLQPSGDSIEGGLNYYRNTTAVSDKSFFYIEVVGASGEKNQQGRVVKIHPLERHETIFTRVVDSGSGFMAQNQYELLVGTPYSGAHAVEVFFSNSTVEFNINPGEIKRVYQDGRIESF